MAQVLTETDPKDKADLYSELGISLTYHPDQRKVVVEACPPIACRTERVGGGIGTFGTPPLWRAEWVA
jgi:hypothetical protein